MMGQTFGDFELLLIDDQSTDGSAQVAAALGERDPRIRLLGTSSPGGLVPALNAGLGQARAPYIARMDADDVSLPHRLAAQLHFMEDNPGLAGCGCAVRITGSAGEGFLRYARWQNSLTAAEAIHRERFVESPLVHPAAFLRTESVRAVGGYRDLPWAEDYDLWLRILERGPILGKVPEVLLHWRDSGNRLTRTDGRYGLARFMALRAEFLARLRGVRERGVAICGAGPTGKSLARHLRAGEVTVHAFHDVHPRRIGERINGIPVLGTGDLRPPGPILLGAVGIPGQREAIRELAAAGGYTEGVDFFLVS